MNKVITESYIFETIQRISRLEIYLDALNAQFFSNEKSIIMDKALFLDSYGQGIGKLIESLLATLDSYPCSTEANCKIIIEELLAINFALHKFQEDILIHLPRPAEPVELRRFVRVIKKQVLQLDDRKDGEISVHISERAADMSYRSDPLAAFKDDIINMVVGRVNRFLEKEKTQLEPLNSHHDNHKNLHISIPRTHASNPFHWPSLLHEVAHIVMKSEWFSEGGIYKNFESYLAKSCLDKSIIEIVDVISLESWLIECWCDLFGCALIGPSFYFSQAEVFLHTYKTNNNKTYPPSIFRLKLISKFIEHRFPDSQNDKNLIEKIKHFEDLVDVIDSRNHKLSFKKDFELAPLFNLFLHFFIDDFFILQNGELNFKNQELSNLFREINQFVASYDTNKIQNLVACLTDDLPIPSYRNKDSATYDESVNYVQEILLAAWLYKKGAFQESILLKISKEIDISNSVNWIGKGNDVFKTLFAKSFQRLDQAILRSIQVSEWFDLLKVDAADAPPNFGEQQTGLPNYPLLSDTEIFNEIEQGNIKVVPIINLKKQLGATSLDIRLGTSFEVFFPNQFGIVDFTNLNTIRNVKSNSKYYNLDFMESIPINPGQFILAHSMEYLRLPEYISGDLEGRSSFARLGIEIHMTAGFVDPGFEGVLTFEIFNAGTNPINLYPGLRIGQLRFSKINKPSQPYADRSTPKYMGLLKHEFSRHGDDYEIARLITEKLKVSKTKKIIE